ncbi:MAG: hypothetical protein HOD43_04510 [Candidatus Marinimicrobia bacterium]|jgi:hypothetical protein|nr:hypothetical protein [Candidatus Neomarinimicrobiota bacterium]MBT3632193.1 hypothetical protein [Candidatus Neomarinimicrobiota bacterium]MBT3824348.1 hypothetical protein [Candidatus Neomarinimicrobiota bacterium]MBT4130061.1 hypothetical protein [Candidatus Neomarinimicrobiota bacterium]MBT4295048.1 hypothetical protein [Candidatus Neomarinimicrobiota bacterium]
MPDNESLAKHPFSYQRSKDGVVRIFRSNHLATTLREKSALRFLSKISFANEENSQLIMAKATGQYKFGNENDRRE